MPTSSNDKQADTMQNLTARQLQVLQIVRDYIRRLGVPPSRGDIARALGIRSRDAVSAHLKILALKGWIELHPDMERGIRLRSAGELPLIEPIGEIAAGEPLLAEERIVDRIPGSIADQFSPRPQYFLKIRGDSMNGIGLNTGDLVAVHVTPVAANGSIVIARFDNEVTCKRFDRTEHRYITLSPISDNPDHKPICIDLAEQDFHIDGIVVGTLMGRKMERIEH